MVCSKVLRRSQIVVRSVSHSFGTSSGDEMTIAVSVHARGEIFSAIITILDRSHRYFEDINNITRNSQSAV
jgi:hypothetical protein